MQFYQNLEKKIFLFFGKKYLLNYKFFANPKGFEKDFIIKNGY